MKIGVLTSSRADYGIYQPLLLKLKTDKRFDVEVIAFGMHLQEKQGFTINAIEADGYSTIHRIGKMPEKDTAFDIALGYGDLVKDFTFFWKEHAFDLVFALGDRWEMSAAIQASLPFEIKIAHIHGGETTLGAIDNIYRHQISLAAYYHFTAAEQFSRRVEELVGKKEGMYTVGSISLEGLNNIHLPKWEEVKGQFNIPFDDFILVTIHPESVQSHRNKQLAEIAFEALENLAKTFQLLITRANSDVLGSLFNEQFQLLEEKLPSRVRVVNSLGKLNYFKAMEQCKLMLGNTSSGIIESASFNKRVVNIGDRQKGRLRNDNVVDVSFKAKEIEAAVRDVVQMGIWKGLNKYIKANTTDTIIKIIGADA